MPRFYDSSKRKAAAAAAAAEDDEESKEPQRLKPYVRCNVIQLTMKRRRGRRQSGE